MPIDLTKLESATTEAEGVVESVVAFIENVAEVTKAEVEKAVTEALAKDDVQDQEVIDAANSAIDGVSNRVVSMKEKLAAALLAHPTPE